MAKKCPNCGNVLTQEMIDVNLCWECGYIIDDNYLDDNTELKSIIKDQRKDVENREYALSLGEYYEYDAESVISKEGGFADIEAIKQVLNAKATKGYKLHTIYSNQLGVNAIKMLGFGTNSTVCEDVIIFERRIKNVDCD